MLGRTENRTGRADDAARGAPLVVGVSWQRRQRHWHPSSMQQMNLQHCWKKMRQPKKKYKNIVVVWYKTEIPLRCCCCCCCCCCNRKKSLERLVTLFEVCCGSGDYREPH